MKIIAQIIVLAVLASAAADLFGAGPRQVLTPAERQSQLDAVRKILSPGEAPLPPTLIDPFHPASFGQAGSPSQSSPVGNTNEPSEPAAPRGDQALLQAIASVLKPSGLFVFSGEATLAFGQKKVKAGSFLTVTFEGNSYTLEITAIDRSTFTLRLNREEFTRPIK